MAPDDRFTRADALLDAALDLATEERAAYLARECAGDDELRALVDRLLAHAETPTVAGRLSPGAGADAGAVDRLLPDLTGRTLHERYRLVREIGRGGMGRVYEARDERLDRPVAVKVLAHGAIDADARERFLREARAAAALNHPAIVAIHDAREEDDQPYLVMELVEGGGLDERPPHDLETILRTASRIAGALGHAHARGIVHRDLKPGNVLGAPPDVKLTDLGIALTRGTARITRTGAVAGTPAYMAPEQALGQTVDGRADLYALGAMLYLWTAGRLPFDGEDALAVVSQHIHAPVVPPRTFRRDLPREVERLILALLAKAPEDRPRSAEEVRAALDAALDAERRAAREAPDRAPDDAAAVVSGGSIECLACGRMVGRRAELARLQELWRDAGDDGTPLALVSGEPGVGKTRLAREMTSAARLDGAPVLSGGCYENEATTPYLPFLEAIRRFVRELDDAALTDALGDAAAELSRLAPEIESRLGPFPARAALSPQEERLRLFDHVARFLERIAAPRGALVFLDDLQWADHGTLALLHYLLRQRGEARLLFLGTYRELELDRAHPLSRALVEWTRERLAERIRLDRLTLDETGKMIETLLGQEEVSREFVVSLHDETEGNPFFLEEIVKALIADGGLIRAGTRWQRASTGECLLPQSVKAAIGSRLERVGERCIEILRIASVLGKMFEFGELAAVAGEDEDALIDALDEAVAAQLLVAGRGESFAFTHDKIREVLYDEVNPVRRRRLHARIAAGLERLHAAGRRVAVEDLAHHFVESGDDENGLLWAGRAAEAACRVFAWDEALALLARARDCAEALGRAEEIARIDALRGDAASAQGDLIAAAEHFERALAATADRDLRNAVRGKVGEVYVSSGDPRGLKHVRAALAELDPERRPAETVLARMVEARYLHLQGQLEEAVRLYIPAVELAESVGDPEALVRVLSYLAGTYQHLADFERSDAVSERCIEIGERKGVPIGVMLGCEFLSENAVYRGDWEHGIAYGEREEALALETHAGERYLWSHMRAYMHHARGRFDEAERLFRRGIEAGTEAGERRVTLFMRAGLAGCLIDLGRVEEAEETAGAALREAEEYDLLSLRVTALAMRAEARLARGRFAEAAGDGLQGIELWTGSDSRGIGLIYGPPLIEARVRGGAEEAEIVAALDRHRAIAEETSAEHRRGQNDRVRGLLDARQGRETEALERLTRAVATFEATDSIPARIRALADRAALLGRLGRDAEAAADLRAAREAIAACGASPDLLDRP